MNSPEKDSTDRPDSEITGNETRNLLNPDSPGTSPSRFERIIDRTYPSIIRLIARDYMARLGDNTYIAGIKIPFMDGQIIVNNHACENPRGTFIDWKSEVAHAQKVFDKNRDKFTPDIILGKFNARSVLNYDRMFRWIDNLANKHKASK